MTQKAFLDSQLIDPLFPFLRSVQAMRIGESREEKNDIATIAFAEGQCEKVSFHDCPKNQKVDKFHFHFERKIFASSLN